MTTLKTRLQHDLTEAMRRRDELTMSTIRLALTAVMNAEVAGDEAVTLSDSQVIALLQAEARKRVEAAEIYANAGRSESAAQERAELDILEKYLPAALSDDDLATIVAEEVATASAAGNSGPKAMGLVVKAVRDRTAGTADGSKIAALVKAALS